MPGAACQVTIGVTCQSGNHSPRFVPSHRQAMRELLGAAAASPFEVPSVTCSDWATGNSLPIVNQYPEAWHNVRWDGSTLALAGFANPTRKDRHR